MTRFFFPKDNEHLALSSSRFLLLFTMLFSLIFVVSSFLFSEEIYIALQRKFVVSHLEKKFGFHGRTKEIKVQDYEYKMFSIESVESGSLFEQAGVKVGDMPAYNGVCRFFVIGKTDEAMFYSQLSSMLDGDLKNFTMVNIDDYRKYLIKNGASNLPKRQITLMLKK